MPTSVKVGGSWRSVAPAGIWTKVSGTWRGVQTGYVKVAGTWRVCYQADQLGPSSVSSASAAFVASAGTTVDAAWTHPSDSDFSFTRVAWYINAPGSPTATQDIYGSPGAAGAAQFVTGAVSSNIYVRLTPYDVSGNPGPTVEIGPSSIRTTPPQSVTVVGWTFSTVTVTWQPPARGTATNYTAELRSEGGSLISSQTTGLLSATFSVATDTKYQIIIKANSVGGVSAAAAVKPWIGHPEVGSWVPVYGWNPTATTTPAEFALVDGGASSAAFGYPTSNLYDAPGGTQWRSAGTFGSVGPVYWECFRFYSPGGNRKLVSVTINGEADHQYYLGAQNLAGTWVGGLFPSNIGMAASGYPFDAAQIYHDYLIDSTESYQTYFKVCVAEPFGLLLQDYQFFNVAISRLVNDGSNWKAVVSDVYLTYRNWVQTGSNWVVTVNVQQNTYW